jgi:hypothetical protein
MHSSDRRLFVFVVARPCAKRIVVKPIWRAKNQRIRLSDKAELDPQNGQQCLQQEGSTGSHHEYLQQQNWRQCVI